MNQRGLKKVAEVRGPLVTQKVSWNGGGGVSMLKTVNDSDIQTDYGAIGGKGCLGEEDGAVRGTGCIKYG